MKTESSAMLKQCIEEILSFTWAHATGHHRFLFIYLLGGVVLCCLNDLFDLLSL